jgi:tryptophan synthase beta chain
MTSKTADAPREKLLDFYQELEQLLRKQLEAKPDLQDVRLKLLELYYETRRGEDFVKAARPLHRELGPKAREWQRIASMGRMLMPGDPLFSGQGSDRIEFIGDSKGLVDEEARRIVRFGDEERFRPLFNELAAAYEPVRQDAKFLAELELLLIGLPTRRPTPLIPARRLSHHLRGAQILIKREDFAGENPHLIVAISGQALFARSLGRKTLVTGSSDGRRGVAMAAVGARLGLSTVVYMDKEQSQRAAANLLTMKLMGARIELVKADHYRNRDVRQAALEHWANAPQESFLMTGLDAAPLPYPLMTQEFTAAIGRECRRQALGVLKRLPDIVVTRGSSTADALGVFPAFLGDAGVRLVCVEHESDGDKTLAKDVDPFTQAGMPLTTGEKKVAQAILDKLEYPSVAREHALLRASGRVEYVHSTRAAAKPAVEDLARLEAVVPPMQTAQALAWACQAARVMAPSQSVVLVMAETLDKNLWDVGQLVGSA